MIRVALLEHTPDPERVVAMSARLCYSPSGASELAEKMTPEAMDALLTMRYLDDWGYQANVRTVVARQLGWFRAAGAYASLDAKRPAIEARASQFMRRFAEENLPPMEDMQFLEVHFPWNRMWAIAAKDPRTRVRMGCPCVARHNPRR